ncbi:MAG: hypothetical protein U0989_06750 [Azonexus sp.]|nr:hypothetical protein [Azonexus sp.]MDZ4314448.1 hypothetical protein [Azonexus sp.]
MTRLEQDETMKTCGQYRDNLARKVGEKLEKLNAATVRYPVDGKLIGDWREGEKLAASWRFWLIRSHPSIRIKFA